MTDQIDACGIIASPKIRAQINKRLRQAGIESLPHVAAKVVEVLGDPDAGLGEIADLVRADAEISGRLIGMSNSAHFSQSKPVTRVDRACVLLGRSRLRALLLGFYLSRVVTNDTSAALSRRVWGESIFRATFAAALSEKTCPEFSGEAFVVGLLLDRGIALMPRLVGEWYEELADEAQSPMDLHINESSLLDFNHVDVIATMGESWMLPCQLLKPIAMHHTPPAPGKTDDPVELLRRVGYYAGQLDLRIDLERPAELLLSPMLASKLFGLGCEELKGVVDHAFGEYALIRGMFEDVADGLESIDELRVHIARQLGDAIQDALFDKAPAENEPGEKAA